jgi:uncharacterized protein (TIGR03435 family)
MSTLTSALPALAVKGTVLLAVAFLILRVVPRASAASRHLVWTATFFALIVLVFAELALPSLPLSVLPASEPRALDAMTWHGQIDQLEEIARRGSPWETAAASELSRSKQLSMPQIVPLIWIAGVVVTTFRSVRAVVAVNRLERATSPANDVQLTERVRHLCTRLGIRRRVAILRSPDHRVPVTWGLSRPAIVLPEAARSWPDVRLDAVLIHELAHVERLDIVAHVAGRIAVALFWWHPLMWIALDRASLEREKACDDVVLGCGASPSGYAADLLYLAQVLRSAAAPAPMALPVVRRSHLERRIAAILTTRSHRHLRSRPSVAVAAFVALSVFPLGAAQLDVRRSRFDAVSVTRNSSGDVTFPHDPGARMSTSSGGICSPLGSIRLTDNCIVMTNMSLREMVQFAYSPSGLIPPRPIIFGGPNWIDSDRFDVVGEIKGTVPLRTPSKYELAPLVRVLLSDRFGLALHHELRSVPIYTIRRTETTAGFASGLLPATAHCLDTAARFMAARNAGPSRHVPEEVDRNCLHEMGAGYIRSGAITVPQLAMALSNRLRGIVRDETALTGTFQLNLTWSTDSPQSLSAAIEQQLHLRLVPTTGAADVLVIDRARFAQEGDGSRSVENSGRR